MKAATVVPGQPEHSAVTDRPDPEASSGELLVEGVLTGVCGTDREVMHHSHGTLPPGQDRMVLFHESVGRVLQAPGSSDFSAGDYVVGVVRRPDPRPCAACAAGEWDFCRNGDYTERGIKGLDGYGSQRWTVDPSFAVRVPAEVGELGVLTEPTSIVAKAWEQVERLGHRHSPPHRALVTGAGSIGLLAAMLGIQRGLRVDVLDQVTEGRKPELVRSLGAEYHTSLDELAEEPEVVIEATGSGQVVFDVLQRTAPNSITVLTGIASGHRTVPVPAAAINNELVMDNDAVVGSVNSNLRHYERAVRALAEADRGWLSQVITRRVPLDDWTRALDGGSDDIKVVVDLQG